MKKSGIIIELADKRKVIVYKFQPLIEQKGKVILNLVDESYKHLVSDNGKAKIIMKDVAVYNEEMQAAKVLGFVD